MIDNIITNDYRIISVIGPPSKPWLNVSSTPGYFCVSFALLLHKVL